MKRRSRRNPSPRFKDTVAKAAFRGEEALAHRVPEIFNVDQWASLISQGFTDVLKVAEAMPNQLARYFRFYNLECRHQVPNRLALDAMCFGH